MPTSPADRTADVIRQLLRANREMAAALETYLSLAGACGTSPPVEAPVPTQGPAAAGPAPAPPPAPCPLPLPVRTAEPQGCAKAVLDTLREVGHRMTGAQIATEMARRGGLHAESAIRAAISTMVDLGVLTNDQSSNPRGYGLPEWS